MTIILILFTIWVNVTTVFALAPDFTMVKWERTMKIIYMAVLTVILMQSRQKLHVLVWVTVFSIGFFGVRGGAFTLLTGGTNLVFGPPASFLSENNALALALIMVVPLFRYLQLNTENRWLRWGLAGAMILCFFSIFGSYSRGAFVGLGAMAGIFWLKSRRRILIGILMTGAIGGAIAFMPPQWFDRMQTIESYEQDKSAMTRINAWTFAFNVAKDRPIIGGGFSVFSDLSLWPKYAPDPENTADAHSIYFEILGEHGFVGLALFLLLGFTTLRTGTWIIRKTKNRPDLRWAKDLAAMLQVGLIGYAASGAFLSLAFFDLFYHYVALMTVTQLVVKKELASTTSELADNTAVATPNPRATVAGPGPAPRPQVS